MRRTVAILFFLAGLATAPLHAQGVEPAPADYVQAFLLSRKGEEQEAAGDMRGALKTYRTVMDTLSQLKQKSPEFQPEMRDWRIKRTMEAIERVQAKLPAGNVPDAGALGDPSGVLPPLTPAENPLNAGDNQFSGGTVPEVVKPAAGRTTKKSTAKVPPPITSGDPIEQIKQRMAQLESQLSETNQELDAEKSRNQQLAKDLEDAVAARAKAESERKKAQDLAELHQSNVLALKSKGDNSSTRVKELEAQVAAAKKLNDERDAELRAAEERIDQLISRSKAVAKKAEEGGKLPGEMKQLQTKLEAQEKSNAELTSKLAGVTKERDDAKSEITRLKELNKQTEKVMADNTALMQKLADAETQIKSFKADAPAKDKEIMALRDQVQDIQKQLAASEQKNSTLQTEVATLQKRVTEYTKEIQQYKADKQANAEDRKKMEDENKMLQGIVMRVLQEDANRAQRRKLVQMEMERQNIQSTALLKQIGYLTQPVVNLSNAERRLFRNRKIEVEDPNTIVMVKGDSADVSKAAAPAAPGEAAKPAEAPAPAPAPATNPAEAPVTTPEKPATPDAEKPKEMAKLDTPSKPELPEKTTEGNEPNPAKADGPAGGARVLPEDIKPIAEQAKQMFDREKYSEAEKLYDKALAAGPTNLYLLSNKAVVQFRMGKLKQSEETFRKALSIAPEDHFCWCTLGIVQYSQGKYDEAVNSLTKSLAINPKNPTAHNYLGITAAQKGWLEAAEKELVTATQLDPKYADAWFNLAVTHTLKQPPNKEEGRKAYQKALEHGAEADPAMEASLK